MWAQCPCHLLYCHRLTQCRCGKMTETMSVTEGKSKNNMHSRSCILLCVYMNTSIFSWKSWKKWSRWGQPGHDWDGCPCNLNSDEHKIIYKLNVWIQLSTWVFSTETLLLISWRHLSCKLWWFLWSVPQTLTPGSQSALDHQFRPPGKQIQYMDVLNINSIDWASSHVELKKQTISTVHGR